MSEIYPHDLEHCRFCPRLADFREKVAVEKRRAYKNETYWGKPVPGFGDVNAPIMILGLAPGAHGSNRTGRPFTGDESGNFLYAALYRVGFANQPTSKHRGDNLVLNDIWITASARCVPPGNKPTKEEVAACRVWLEHDFSLLKSLKLVLALGQIAHDAYLELLKAQGHTIIKRHYPFAHGALHRFENARPLLDAYHVSFQNTNTGKLTTEMFDAVLEKAKSFMN
ncbi:MAG: uracil-DNA glycosylase [Trueperaceae bacterium]